MAQYTNGGCYNLGQASQATFTYHSNAGDGSYMDIKFVGGDGGRSSEITYYCNRQGTGISSFQYDYESPTKNYVRTRRVDVGVCARGCLSSIAGPPGAASLAAGH